MMSSRRPALAAALVPVLAATALQAADVSAGQAEAFARKMTVVVVQGAVIESGLGTVSDAARRTAFTEDELNAYITYHGGELLPAGVSNARLTIIGDGRVAGDLTVDLDALAGPSGGNASSPWSYLTGRIPVSVTGVLHSADGVGRFELERAAISGVPVPSSLVQDLVAHYSRSPEEPRGVRLDEAFMLPASISRIEVGRGQAVVVQ